MSKKKLGSWDDVPVSELFAGGLLTDCFRE